MNKKHTLAVALIGFGGWGKNLARNLNSLKALRVICDLRADFLRDARKDYPNVDLSDSIENVLLRKDIQGVVIATPPATHRNLALCAMKAGKDVFVEKPLALNVADGQQIVNCATREKRVLLVGHVLEYHPAVLKLKSLLEEGALGKTRYFYSHRLNFGRIRTEENALWSFAPHDIAVMLRLFGGVPEKISCLGGSYLTPGLADTTMTNFQFVNGVQGHIFVSWLHPFKVHRMVLIGDKQMAVFDDTQPWSKKLMLFPHQVDWVKGQIPVARQAEGVPVLLEEKEPLFSECEQFLSSIVTRKNPITDGSSAVKVLNLLQCAQKSISMGGAVIDIGVTSNDLHKNFSAKQSDFYIHPTAVVDPCVQIGRGTKLWHFSHVMEGVRIGKNCILGQNTFVGKNVVLGNSVKVQNNVSLYEGVTLEDFVFCGPSVVFTNVINPRSEVERKTEFKKTFVRRGATLGANATILCGIIVGQYAFVAAGAVVTKDVPDYALVVGVPAKVAGWVCSCGGRLKKKTKFFSCSACAKKYKHSNKNLLIEA